MTEEPGWKVKNLPSGSARQSLGREQGKLRRDMYGVQMEAIPSVLPQKCFVLPKLMYKN
jgi:hypothetical protein